MQHHVMQLAYKNDAPIFSGNAWGVSPKIDLSKLISMHVWFSTYNWVTEVFHTPIMVIWLQNTQGYITWKGKS